VWAPSIRSGSVRLDRQRLHHEGDAERDHDREHELEQAVLAGAAQRLHPDQPSKCALTNTEDCLPKIVLEDDDIPLKPA
jgi:hypothetical protein